MNSNQTQMQTRLEIKAVICYADTHETETRYFHEVEKAWDWVKTQTRFWKNRRDRTKRREVRWSYYVGATITGKPYGGWLKKPPVGPGIREDEIEDFKASWLKRMCPSDGKQHVWLEKEKVNYRAVRVLDIVPGTGGQPSNPWRVAEGQMVNADVVGLMMQPGFADFLTVHHSPEGRV